MTWRVLFHNRNGGARIRPRLPSFLLFFPAILTVQRRQIYFHLPASVFNVNYGNARSTEQAGRNSKLSATVSGFYLVYVSKEYSLNVQGSSPHSIL